MSDTYLTSDGRIGIRVTPQEPTDDEQLKQLVQLTPDLSKGSGMSILDKLFGLGGQDRYQTWPERLGRSAVTLPGQVASGEIPTYLPSVSDDPSRADFIDNAVGGRVMNPEITQRALDLGNFAMVGGMPSAVKGALGMTGGKLTQPSAAPVWHSAVEHAVANAKQDAGSPEQWMGMIRNTPGVKQEEIQWLGLEDWMKAQKHPVTRDQIQQYIDSHRVEVKDALNTNKSDEDGAPQIDSEVVMDQWRQRHMDDMPEIKMEKHGDHYKVTIDGADAGGFGNVQTARDHVDSFKKAWKEKDWDTLQDRAWDIEANSVPRGEGEIGRYAEYQLPGGKNYNELLLTLPHTGNEKFHRLANRMENQGGDSPLDFQNEREQLGFARSIPGINSGAEAKEFLQFLKDRDNEKTMRIGPYQSGHWDEPNVLAHVRFNDRTINGKKTLFMEEVQSDWHQAGRKRGYKTGDAPNDREIDEIWRRAGQPQLTSRNWGSGYDPVKVASDLVQQGKMAEEDLSKIVAYGNNQRSVVPDAPFKKSWPDLTLKRMVKYAADNGYDAIGWTPGEVQAKRWRGTGEEGHGKFYDEILVNAANKIAKPHGGKVDEAKMSVGEKRDPKVSSDDHLADSLEGKKARRVTEQQSVHYLELPQALKDTAQRKGFPLFSGGHMLVPVDNGPEDRSLLMKKRVEQARDLTDKQPPASAASPSYGIRPPTVSPLLKPFPSKVWDVPGLRILE